MSGEISRIGRGDMADYSGSDDPAKLVEQWAEHYWDFYKETHPGVTMGVQEALQDSALALEAQSMYDRAQNTADLIMSLRTRKVGARVVDTPPLQAEQSSELEAA